MNQILFSSGLFLESTPFNTIEELSVSGSTSIIYRVTKEGRVYLLKRLRPEYNKNWRFRAAYHKEYEVGKSIKNKHVVNYIKIDEDEDGVYLLMEFVYGTTILQKLQSNPEYFAKIENFEKLFIQLLAGIGALHEVHIAYLDINPKNIMLTQVNNDVVIIDLGFCFADSYCHTSGSTSLFTAPELKHGDIKEVDASSDIYAIGRFMQFVKETACVQVPSHLQHIINRCMSEKKQDRYSNVNEAIRDIQCKRKRTRFFLITTLILGVLCSGITYFSYAEYFHPHRQKLGWLLTFPDYDFKYNKNYYRIVSEDSLTCIVVGGERNEDLYLNNEIPHNGKTYRNIAIAPEAFAWRNMQSVYIPEGIREIGESAFQDCHNILTLYLPESVDTLGKACFQSLDNLTYVTLSPNTRVISENAFTGCKSLKKVDFPEGVESIELDAFALCSSLTHVKLPSTLKRIKRGAFWRCRNLQTITLPASLKSIGTYAFYDCDSLKHVYSYSPTPPVAAPIFNHKGVIVHVPKGSEELYRKASHWNYTTVVTME